MQANPFDTPVGREFSCYCQYQNERLVCAREPDRAVPAVAHFTHSQLRHLVLAPEFVCVPGRAALLQNDYRFGMYPEVGSPEAVAGLAYDLFTFVQEHPLTASDRATFIACFNGPIGLTEPQWEEIVWKQLQGLHDVDARFHTWDTSVSADPDSSFFCYSFAGRAFFVVAMYAANSRFARRFAWPVLVFNAHHQFDVLRDKGLFEKIKTANRAREILLQGSIHPEASDFGEGLPEWHQYFGRALPSDQRCPFHAHGSKEQYNEDEL